MDARILDQVEWVLSQMTQAERSELRDMLATDPLLSFSPERLALTDKQTAELSKLRTEYSYQFNVAEIQLQNSASADFLINLAAVSKARGCVEILTYLVQLSTPTQTVEE